MGQAKRGTLLVALATVTLISVLGTAQAGWVPLTGDPVSISSLIGQSLIVGDKQISEFDMFGIGTGGAIAPSADSVFVQGGVDDASGNYGLRFLLSWNAFSGQTVNANLGFKAAILPGYEDFYIDDVWLMVTGASATGTGGVNVAETLWDAPFPEGSVIASLSCSKQPDDGGIWLTDYAAFGPLKEIWVRSKDISITGGTDGAAHLSEVFQFYSQVPEPATIALLGMGTLAMLKGRRKLKPV